VLLSDLLSCFVVFQDADEEALGGAEMHSRVSGGCRNRCVHSCWGLLTQRLAFRRVRLFGSQRIGCFAQNAGSDGDIELCAVVQVVDVFDLDGNVVCCIEDARSLQILPEMHIFDWLLSRFIRRTICWESLAPI
jgi:hypothetical protein